MIEDYGYGIAQDPKYRPFIQLFQRLTYLCLFLLPFTFSTNARHNLASIGLKGYIVGTTVQCLLGLYQVVAIKFSLPVWNYSLGDMQEVGGLVRLNGFAGEPRHFAVFILPSLCYLLFNLFFGKKLLFKRNYQLAQCIMHFVCLFLSFSATGIFLFIAAILLGFMVYLRGKNFKALIYSSSVIVIIASVYVTQSDEETLNDRVVKRFAVDYYQTSEYSTYAVYELLNKEFQILYSGVGVGLPTFLLKEMPTYKASYSRNKNLDLNTVRDPAGIALVIIESGILGGVFLIFSFGYLFKQARQKRDLEKSLAAYFLLCVYLTGLVSYGPLSPLFIGSFGLYLCQYRKVES
jgi:hypothetical protein